MSVTTATSGMARGTLRPTRCRRGSRCHDPGDRRDGPHRLARGTRRSWRAATTSASPCAALARSTSSTTSTSRSSTADVLRPRRRAARAARGASGSSTSRASRRCAPAPTRPSRSTSAGRGSSLEEALRAGVGRVVHTSSVAAIGPARRRGSTADERPGLQRARALRAPLRRRQARGRARGAAHLAAHGLPVVIVNPAHVLGAGRPLPLLHRARAPLPAPARSRPTWTVR